MSAPPPAASLNTVLVEVQSQHGTPAITALVAQRGVVLAEGAIGVCSRGGVPVGASDTWHIGSCAKAMTAAALDRLVVAQQLDWQATMADVFPELANGMNVRMRAVTVQNLVDHRSGLPENHTVGSAFTRQIDRHASPRQKRYEITEAALADAPVGEPGTSYAYANTNFLIAGAVLERLTDKPWLQAMQELVFAPLGMSSANVGQPTRVRGHLRMFGKLVATRANRTAALLPDYYGPSGDVHMTLRDWLRFVDEVARQPWPVTKELSYARGFVLRGAEELAHQGASPWWRCYVRVDRVRQRVVLVGCNEGGDVGESVCVDVAARLMRWRAR